MKFWSLTLTRKQMLRLAMLKTILRKKRNNNKPQQKSNHRLQQVADYKTGDCLKEGTQIFIVLSVQQKMWKKVRLNTSTKTARLCLCWVLMFVTEIFHLLVEETNVYYQQHLDGQAGPSRWPPDITLLDMMPFNALALQMEHELKDTIQAYWLRFRQLHTPFYRETMKQDRFLYILSFSAFCRQFTETW